MNSGSILIDVFLNYVTLTVASIALIAVITVLVTKRRTIPHRHKIIFSVTLGIIVLYFIFVICAVGAIDSNPPFAYP